MCLCVSFGCVVVVVVLFGCVGWIGFFLLFIVLESGLTGFFSNFKFVIVVFVIGVCRFGVWVVFVISVFGLFCFCFVCLGS